MEIMQKIRKNISKITALCSLSQECPIDIQEKDLILILPKSPVKMARKKIFLMVNKKEAEITSNLEHLQFQRSLYCSKSSL
jgi:hypothetical protein